jgi:hypothetical protein
MFGVFDPVEHWLELGSTKANDVKHKGPMLLAKFRYEVDACLYCSWKQEDMGNIRPLYVEIVDG